MDNLDIEYIKRRLAILSIEEKQKALNFLKNLLDVEENQETFDTAQDSKNE